MKIKWVVFAGLFLLVASNVHPATLIDENFENGWGSWECYSGPCSSNANGVGIVDDTTSPDGGTKTLRFLFPAGFPDGSSPDIVSKMFSGQSEIWAMYYFKVSSNWSNHPVFNKHLYLMDYATVPDGHSEFIGHSWWGDNYVGFTTQDQKDTMDFYGSGISIQAGRWYRVTWQLVSNNPANNYTEPGCDYKCRRSNGIVNIWVKDMVTGAELKSIGRTNVLIRTNINSRYDRLKIAPVWGGEAGAYIPQNQYMYFDRVIIANTDPRGNVGHVSTPSPQPSPPSNLAIK